jgi:hypothetical protein
VAASLPAAASAATDRRRRAAHRHEGAPSAQRTVAHLEGREKPDRPEFKGLLELSFEGVYNDGRAETITLARSQVTFGHYLHVTGQTDLPAGFVARRANARLFDLDGKRQITWRVFPIVVN